MKKFAHMMMICMAMVFSVNAVSAQDKAKSIKDSYYGAIGEKPTAAEMDYWMKQPYMDALKMLENHRTYMKSNRSFAEKAINKSYLYQFGRLPSRGEIDYWVPQNKLFMELVDNHLAYMRSNAKEWGETVARAYIYATNGKPMNDAQLKTWTAKPRTDYLTLVDQMKAAGVR